MRPAYPLTQFLLEHEAAETTVVRRRAASGRIRTHDLGSFSDHAVKVTHCMIKWPQVELVMDLWRDNRGQLFDVFHAEMNQHWVGGFLGKPDPQHVEGPWYDLVVTMVRYDPREGGL